MVKFETKMELEPEQPRELLRVLKNRFEKNMNRHKSLEWAYVLSLYITTVQNLTMQPGDSAVR